MNQRPPQPPHGLDAEERALARALPRLHGRTAPGPDLDASILAAAQAAARPAKPSRRPAKPRIRWIASASLAASVMLAVGLAWQLRPLPTPGTTWPSARSGTADEAAVRMIEPAQDDKTASPVQSKPAPAPDVGDARERAMSPAIDAQEAAPVSGDRSQQAPPPSSPAALAESVSPAVSPAPAPAPPAPSAAILSTGAPARDGAPTESSARSSAASAGNTSDTQAMEQAGNVRTLAPAAAASASRDNLARDAAATNPSKTGMLERSQQAAPKALAPATPAPISRPEARNEARMAADAGFVDDPDQDVPPATVDAPAVRDAWLNRIVELLDQGQRQDAKASLAEFRRRYPAATLPPRLRALEIEP